MNPRKSGGDAAMEVKLLSPEAREAARCHFCGEARSVKYMAKVNDPTGQTHSTDVPCCNRCALRIIADKNTTGGTQI